MHTIESTPWYSFFNLLQFLPYARIITIQVLTV